MPCPGGPFEGRRTVLSASPFHDIVHRMGLLTTRWEATYEGHNLTVLRNELGRGFTLEWDGKEIARRSWSLVGLGELHGSAEAEGKAHEVKAVLAWAGLSELDGKCTISVDGTELEVRHIR